MPMPDPEYSFRFDRERDSWICSVHGEIDYPCWVTCWHCSPGEEWRRCAECHGGGGWYLCPQCNADNQDMEM